MLKVLELFSGIGAWKRALEELEIKHIALRAEICEKTDKAYRLLHGCGLNNMFDHCDLKKQCDNNIGNVSKVIDFLGCDGPDIILASPPCQGFSSMNRYKENDKTKLNNDLSFKTIEIIQKLQPKAFVIENVINFKKSDQFKKIMDLENYFCLKIKINSLNLNWPQNRKRLFIIGFKAMEDLPNGEHLKIFAELELLAKEKRPLTNHLLNFLNPSYEDIKNIPSSFVLPKNAKLKKNGVGYTWGNSISLKANFIHEFSPTITSVNNQPLICSKSGIVRKLSSLECMLLMGFKKADYFKLKDAGFSQSFIKKIVGNSIVIPVIKEILKLILK